MTTAVLLKKNFEGIKVPHSLRLTCFSLQAAVVKANNAAFRLAALAAEGKPASSLSCCRYYLAGSCVGCSGGGVGKAPCSRNLICGAGPVAWD